MSRDDVDVESMKSGINEEEPRDPNVVDFDGPSDPENPLNWSTTKKTTPIVIVSLTTLLSRVSSSIYSDYALAGSIQGARANTSALSIFIGSTISAGSRQHHAPLWHADETLGTLMTTIHLLEYVFSPLVIAPLLDIYGHAIMYNSCTLLFAVFNVACAVANSFGSLVVYRLLASITGSCAGTQGASSIVDMIVREERGLALDTNQTTRQLFTYCILRPFKMLISPIVFFMSAYAATLFSNAYLCFRNFPRIFKDQYGFSSGASGQTSIGLGVVSLWAFCFALLSLIPGPPTWQGRMTA
ncbi:Fluconazole resistance protein 1-like protein 2 [Colletotrichum chlorophyti]|uniref:Fluconazole resistance protein 1-like protein 2 n=1 Tax=Colletotrichum chlorophyti TaxID=708187 RepID=A0A1Q8S890_9PEZI|nr:Fluconazole resistance protein 1-like protein 2 [Colletotrichum chlorophyti]